MSNNNKIGGCHDMSQTFQSDLSGELDPTCILDKETRLPTSLNICIYDLFANSLI